MSTWSHVCGCIRIDSFRFPEDEEKEIQKIKDTLGKTVDYNSEDWDTDLPLGSEGSLNYEVIVNPERSCLAAYTVPIWGDLRDYDNVSEIEEWFEKCCKTVGIIRSAVLQVEVEGYGNVCLSWDFDNGAIKKVDLDKVTSND